MKRTAISLIVYMAAAAATASGIDDAARQWKTVGSAAPVTSDDGRVLFPFGDGEPTITCRPLHGCDIQMETGEVIQNLMLGDTPRWITAKAKTGADPDATYHVVIKPTRAGLETNMLITTSKRTYSATLKSVEVDSPTRYGWYYPADMVQSWANQEAAAKKAEEDHAKLSVGTLPIASIAQLHLDDYEIRGRKSLPWYPVRVFDDGTHVWIQMPRSAASSDAPALILINDAGDAELVNYRLKPATQGTDEATYYIVDKIFDHAALIAGVGSDQQKIEIVRKSAQKGLIEGLFQ